MKEKKINLDAVSLIIKIGMMKTYADLEAKFDEWPEDPNGTLVTLEQVRVGLVKLEKFGMDLVEGIVGKLPDVDIPVEPEELPYETEFHHTMSDPDFKGDGGTSLVSCPGQVWDFVDVRCNGIKIPRHGSRDEDNREGYWNMFEAPVGDIIATDKDGNKRRFKTTRGKVYRGSCG